MTAVKQMPTDKIDFSGLPAEQIEAMRESGEMILECQRVLRNTEQNIVGELLRFTDEFLEWNHLPEKDVHDKNSHGQYYYHTHTKGYNDNTAHDDEHGHFHIFLRAKGMPDNIRPLKVPDLDPNKSVSDMLSHIIGIGMDSYGVPIKIFTVNRWVTGETWYKAADVIRMLDIFEIDHAYPSWPVNLWVTNMLRLFRPQIEQLLLERDEAVKGWIASHPDENVYEDRKLELTSWCPVNIAEQISALA